MCFQSEAFSNLSIATKKAKPEHICYNRGRWEKEQYHLQNKSDDCELLISQFLKGAQRNTWLFLGDSVMRYIIRTLVYSTLKKSNCTTLKQCRTKCTLSEYLKMSPYTVHVAARDYPSCNDHSNGCGSRKYRCGNVEIEYLKQLFVTELQKNNTRTEFDKIISYLEPKPRDICVANLGMHDQQKEGLTARDYTNSVKQFLLKMENYCGKLIWLSTNAVKGDPRFKQTNTGIQEWNEAVRVMVQADLPYVAFIDMFPMSTLISMHRDNVHMNGVYYKKVASFFAIP